MVAALDGTEFQTLAGRAKRLQQKFHEQNGADEQRLSKFCLKG